MTKYKAGTTVRGGYYWNLDKWAIAGVPGDAGMLEGTTGEQFVRLPLPLMIAVAATVSFGFVIFLPLIGFALLGYALVKKAGDAGAAFAHETAATLAHAWRPGEAHFTGKAEDAPRKDAPAAGSDPLAEVKKELARRKDEEKSGRES